MDHSSSNSNNQEELATQLGVDLSLVDLNLRLSFEERIQKHDEAARFIEELVIAGKAWAGKV